jgi:polysaccharide biosynthesis transport protein
MAQSDYLRILRKYWALLLGAVLLGAGGGLLAAVLQSPMYSASARVFVSVQSGQTTADLAEGVTYSQSRVASYATLADSERVLADVAATLGLQLDLPTLQERVSATIVPETTVIELRAESEGAESAAALADAVAGSLTATVVEIESRPGLASPVQLVLVQSALVPEDPIYPRPIVYITLGALAGLVLAAAFALIRQARDTRIRVEQDVRDVTDAPVLGAIAFDPKAKRRPLIVHSDPHSPRAESFRALRTSLQFIKLDRSRAFVVTSTLPGDGKSTTTVNLALALADAGRSVVLIDADLRKPRAAEYLGLDGTVGLTDVLIGDAELGDAVQQWGASSLVVLPAGQIPPNPSELLDSQAMAALMQQLQADYDWVLLDAPPLLPVTDAAVLSKRVGGLILVAAAGKTTKHQLGAAVRMLSTVGTEVSGVVLSMVPTRGADAYGLGHYRYAHYRQTGRRGRAKPVGAEAEDEAQLPGAGELDAAPDAVADAAPDAVDELERALQPTTLPEPKADAPSGDPLEVP